MREYIIDYPDFNIIQPSEIEQTHKKIAPYIHRTPILTSSLLNQWLGHNIYFKAENLQKTGAFKVRGAINKILSLKESKDFSGSIVAFSSGNHSQAVAWASKQFGINSTIFLPQITSSIKYQATRSYGAKVIVTKTRQEAEKCAYTMEREGAHLVPPYDADDIIKGQGTAVYEALQDMESKPDAIFTACGGGGLLSGSYLAKELLSPSSKIFGAEPHNANDASLSYQKGKIYRFDNSPLTIADGVRTLSLSPRTFHYVKQTDGIIEASEHEICRWVQIVSHLLKILIEPASGLAMASANNWLKHQTTKQTVLIVLSGGNIAPDTSSKIWEKNYLEMPFTN